MARQVLVMEQVLHGGERELAESREAVRLLRLEVRKLRWERQLLARDVGGQPRLQQELYHTVQVRLHTPHTSHLTPHTSTRSCAHFCC